MKQRAQSLQHVARCRGVDCICVSLCVVRHNGWKQLLAGRVEIYVLGVWMCAASQALDTMTHHLPHSRTPGKNCMQGKNGWKREHGLVFAMVTAEVLAGCSAVALAPGHLGKNNVFFFRGPAFGEANNVAAGDILVQTPIAQTWSSVFRGKAY